MKQQLTRNFLEGSHRFAKTSLGYEASEPPRGVAWITLIRTQPKGTYNDYLTVTNKISFLGRAMKEDDRRRRRRQNEEDVGQVRDFLVLHGVYNRVCRNK